MINREDTKFEESTAINAQNIDENAKKLEELDVNFAFRLIRLVGPNGIVTLDKKDYHGYLNVDAA